MRTGHPAWKFLRSALPGLLLAAPFVLPAHASPSDPLVPLIAIAPVPLYNATTSLVKPNVPFMLDDSSSMAYNYLPDEVPRDITLLGNPNTQTDTHAVALTSSQCNGVAYNPSITYTVPVDSTGAPMTAYSVDAARSNGYDSTSATTDLDGTSLATSQFYYVYGNGGTQTPLSYSYANGVVDTSTTFYQECNSPTNNAPLFTKVIVRNLTAAQKQNYANWFSYYRTRLLMMKTLAGQTFQPVTDAFRIGLSTIHDTGADETATFLPSAAFDAGQKVKFFTKLYGINADASSIPQQYTPLRGALSKAGRYYAGKFFTGGTSDAEKARDPVQYSCQQNFTLMASDGYWNSSDDATNFGPFALDNVSPVGDQDSGSTPLPLYDALGKANTLADVAMYYYQTDLRKPDNCTSGATGANLCPVDSTGAYAPNVPTTAIDNNIKPHMTTMTVGLAINGLLGYTADYATATSGDYYDIKTGVPGAVWPDPRTLASPFAYDATIRRQIIERVDDLWHTAVNGRGTYFNAKNPTTVVTALKGAIGGVANRLGYGTAGATSSLAPIAGNNSLYVATYTTGQWTGNLIRETINTATGEVNPVDVGNGGWCVEDIPADPLKGTPACVGRLAFQAGASSDGRTIYFNNAGTLASFTYTNLSATQKAYFDNTKLSQYTTTWSATDKTTATGTTLVDYLRGQSQYESQDGSTANLYRKRLAKLGDVVGTQPLFVGKPFYHYADPGYTAWKNATAQQNRAKTVLVGANDGMLHAFDADTGDERWAFVPTPVMPNMYWLADLTYATNHHNYVNGRLVYSDVCVAGCSNPGTADWRTILMGALDGGGRGIYALDVTDPAVPTMLWEFTSLNDADFGYSFGNPLAVKKADGTWVVMVSSGYDNVKLNITGDPYDVVGTGKGFLYVLNPLTGSVINKIPTGEGSVAAPSGLGRMSYWADNPETNATALNAYGGDLLGNLWRFDINTLAVLKLATFKDASNNLQPITTRPEMTMVGSNRMIFTATGKYLEISDLDPAKFKTQSLYAIIDQGTLVADPRSLAKRILTNARPIRTVSRENDTQDPALGWFVDFPDSGERSNIDMVLAIGTLLVPTNVPTNEICDAGGYSWLNYLDYKTGETVGGASGAAIYMSGNDLTTGINVVWINGVPQVIRTGNNSAPALVQGITFGGGAAAVTGHRVGWREFFKK